MTFLLDTNIVSELIKPVRPPRLIEWLEKQALEDLFVATMTLGEIWRGILELRSGQRRRELETWFAGPDGPRSLFEDRILPLDTRAALEWARMMAEGTASGRPRSGIDMIIATINPLRMGT